MDPRTDTVEMLERALVIVAQILSCDPEFTPEEQAATQEQIIRIAKIQAFEAMEAFKRRQ